MVFILDIYLQIRNTQHVTKTNTMKIVSTLKSTKADTELKHNRIISANRRSVRYEGETYQITSARIGKEIVASATPFKSNGDTINLFDKSIRAREIRKLVENNLFS